jgi:hypothetical protein
MLNRFSDLRLVIGLFLFAIGALVLLSWAVGPDDLKEGIHVNLLGGGMLLATGLALGLPAWFGGAKE